MKLGWMIPAIALASISASVNAQESQKLLDGYGGISIGVFLPESSLLSDAFGDSIVSYGFTSVNNRFEDKWLLKPDFFVLTANKDGNDLLVFSGTLGYERSFGDRTKNSVPYLRAGVGVSYYDYDFTAGAISKEGSGFGGTANVEAGFIINQRFKLSARYNWFTEKDDINFNGLQFIASIGVFKF